MNREKIKSVYRDLVKLYKSAPEGSFTRACLQLACRSVQVACQSKSMQKIQPMEDIDVQLQRTSLREGSRRRT